tara:strand:+ start:1822 stop:2343 length:522 start_codon:yes stop_codon:yes gene_type:complete
MSQEYYFQKGGASSLPNRWFNKDAQAFSPCQSCNLTPKNGKKQKGGAIRMPYRWFNPNSTPFKPCESCQRPKTAGMAVYANDFMRGQGCHDYNSCNMSSGNCQGCDSGCCKGECGLNCGCVNCGCINCRKAKSQKGGNPTGAPFHAFQTGTQELKYNFDLQETFSGLPVFDRV